MRELPLLSPLQSSSLEDVSTIGWRPSEPWDDLWCSDSAWNKWAYRTDNRKRDPSLIPSTKRNLVSEVKALKVGGETVG